MASQTVKKANRYAGMKVVTVLAGLAIVGVAPVAEADFLILLRNGREIKVSDYEEQGDHIVYKKYQGKISIPTAQVETIKDLSKPEGQQEVARCADEANGMGSLRDFLPPAGSIATYKGTTVRRERSSEGFMDSLRRLVGQETQETTSTFEETVSYNWRSERDGEYYIATNEHRERLLLSGSEALQLTKRADNYEVTCDQLARRTMRVEESGPRRQRDAVTSYDPPQVRLLWPLTERRSTQQTTKENVQPQGGTPRTTERTCTILFKGDETIHTPAGDFRAWRIEKGCRMPRSYKTTWWAKGIGVVKWQTNSWQPGSRQADPQTPSKSVSGALVDFKQPNPAHTPSR